MLNIDNIDINFLEELKISRQRKRMDKRKIILVIYYLNFVNVITFLYLMVEPVKIKILANLHVKLLIMSKVHPSFFRILKDFEILESSKLLSDVHIPFSIVLNQSLSKRKQNIC